MIGPIFYLKGRPEGEQSPPCQPGNISDKLQAILDLPVADLLIERDVTDEVVEGLEPGRQDIRRHAPHPPEPAHLQGDGVAEGRSGRGGGEALLLLLLLTPPPQWSALLSGNQMEFQTPSPGAV